MAYSRGRTVASMGELFGPYLVDSGSQPSGEGHPTRVRTWGVPTGSGWFDRPAKWNVLLPPLLLMGEFIRSVIEKWGK